MKKLGMILRNIRSQGVGAWPDDPEILEDVLDLLGCEAPLKKLYIKSRGLRYIHPCFF